MERYLTWPLLVGVVLLGNSCMVTAEQFQALQQDVRSLRGEVNAMSKEGDVSGQGLGAGGGGIGQTDVVARLEELSVETRMVQGKLEENTFRLSELSQRLDATEVRVNRLLGEAAGPSGGPQAPLPGVSPSLPSGTGQPLPPRGGGVSPPQSPAVARPGLPGVQESLPSPEEVYRAGLSDYTKGNYDLAIRGFKNYLTFYPKTTLVPNAQYWLAESYYSQRKYPDAIREFDKVIKDYPGSTKVPSAMLKQGYAYLELGETSQAQGVLRELVAKFPRSREARLAQDRLDRLQ